MNFCKVALCAVPGAGFSRKDGGFERLILLTMNFCYGIISFEIE
jgi:hypothetical protein